MKRRGGVGKSVPSPHVRARRCQTAPRCMHDRVNAGATRAGGAVRAVVTDPARRRPGTRADPSPRRPGAIRLAVVTRVDPGVDPAVARHRLAAATLAIGRTSRNTARASEDPHSLRESVTNRPVECGHVSHNVYDDSAQKHGVMSPTSSAASRSAGRSVLDFGTSFTATGWTFKMGFDGTGNADGRRRRAAVGSRPGVRPHRRPATGSGR